MFTEEEAIKSSPERDFNFCIADGTNRLLRTRCKVTYNVNDELAGLVWACQDMTLLQEAQDQKDAALKLVHAERGLTEFLSHEVRNPLSVTMEALQTLQELTASCDHVQGGYSASECHQVMTESISYVVDLLNNMMDLDQCAQGDLPVVSAPCQVRDDILLPTYRMMKRLRPHHGVHLRLAPSLMVEIATTEEEDAHHNSYSFFGDASGRGEVTLEDNCQR